MNRKFYFGNLLDFPHQIWLILDACQVSQSHVEKLFATFLNQTWNLQDSKDNRKQTYLESSFYRKDPERKQKKTSKENEIYI